MYWGVPIAIVCCAVIFLLAAILGLLINHREILSFFCRRIFNRTGVVPNVHLNMEVPDCNKLGAPDHQESNPYGDNHHQNPPSKMQEDNKTIVEVPTALSSRSRSTPDSDRSYSDSPKGSLYRPSSISSSSPANIDNDRSFSDSPKGSLYRPSSISSSSTANIDNDRSFSDSPKGSLYRPSSISSSSPANIDNDTVSQSSKIVEPEEKSYNKRASTRHSINVGKGSSKISACPMPTASIAPKRYSRNQIRFGVRSLSSRQDNDAETQSRMRSGTSPVRIISDLVLNRNGNYVELIRKVI